MSMRSFFKNLSVYCLKMGFFGALVLLGLSSFATSLQATPPKKNHPKAKVAVSDPANNPKDKEALRLEEEIFKRGSSDKDGELSDIQLEELALQRSEANRLKYEKDAASFEAEIEKSKKIDAQKADAEAKVVKLKQEEQERLDAEKKLKEYEEQDRLRASSQNEFKKLPKVDHEILEWKGLTTEPDIDFTLDEGPDLEE